MKSNILTILRFGLALLTIAILALHPYVPKRKQLIHPLPTTLVSIHGHIDPVKVNSTTWINKENSAWRCDYRPEYGHVDSCGFVMSWGSNIERDQDIGSNTPTCKSAASDDDGDGWGWENEKSCVVLVAQTQEQKAPDCKYADSDEDGDGWGWENEKTCIITTDSKKTTKTTTSAETGVEETDIEKASADKPPVCVSAYSDEDGDGWGWENERSCIVKKESENNENGESEVEVKGVDISDFDFALVKIHYEGSAKNLRLYLRNFNSEYANPEDLDSSKFMSVPVRTEDLKVGAAKINMTEFKVDEWWIAERNLPRKWTRPELDSVIAMGVDISEFGVHKVRVERVEFYGERITRDTLLLILTICWCIYLIFEGVARYVALNTDYKLSEEKIDLLADKNSQLEEEKGSLKALSVTDTLTGVLNRNGLEQEYKKIMERETGGSLGVLMLDIDHFKRINDTHGHDVGDEMLQKFVKVVALQLRQHDVLARWGGEEFIVLCPGALSYKVINLAEKIRIAIGKHTFTTIEEIKVTVSIGVTMFRANEDLDSAYQRADVALYKAKDGRNRVEFEV